MYSQQQQKVKTSNEIFLKLVSNSKKILKDYTLCDNCTGRLFAKKLGVKSNKLLGKKIKNFLNLKQEGKCFICKQIFSNLNFYLDKMLEASSGYEFSTFLVGAIFRPSVTDRDDIIRSRLKLRGIDSVKTDLTQKIGRQFAKKTKTKVDHQNPDLTFTINFKDNSCEVRARPLFFYGRYLKKTRGVSQKQKPCNQCKGVGCLTCNFHGISKFDSVEGKIAKFLFEKLEGKKVTINWIGGEDKESLVLGKGRPFFVKLLNPKKRRLRASKRHQLNGIVICYLKPIKQVPNEPLYFKSTIEISIKTKKRISNNVLKHIRILKKTPILIHEKTYKKIQKKIYEIKYKKNSPNSFSLLLKIDGGVPIKRFVEGNNVNPNLSELLENSCTCEKFDFKDIELLR